MEEESANDQRARIIFEHILKGNGLVESECRFFKNFVDEKLEEQLKRREELERLLEKKSEKEKSNFSVSSHDISSDLGEEILGFEKVLDLKSEEEVNVNVARKENEQEDRVISACSSRDDSQCEETERTLSQKRYPNEPLVDYCSFVSMDNRFLNLTREPLPFADELKNEFMKYPLNVQYDEYRSIWYICDQKASKIIKIKTSGEDPGVEVIEHKSVPQPSAICILKEGQSIAILCENLGYSIVEYFSAENETDIIVSHKNPIYDIKGNLRGLAKSYGENLMSLEIMSKAKDIKYLVIFKKDVGAARFRIEGAAMPCFIASNKTNVAISDLGSNKVYLYKVDDTDWNNIRFERLRTIESKPHASASQLCNCSGFAYVAGLQFDVSGNLLIGDARGHTIKLYDQDLTFLHRLSSDFPMPYMSSFWVNSEGKMMILDIRSPKEKLIFAQLGNIKDVKEWNPAKEPAYGANRQFHRK